MSDAQKIQSIPCDHCGKSHVWHQPMMDRLITRAHRNYEKFGKKKAYAVVTGGCHFCETGKYTIRADVNFGYNSWLTDVDI